MANATSNDVRVPLAANVSEVIISSMLSATSMETVTETSTDYDTCPSEEEETNSTSCVVYSFVVQTVIIGILGVFGTIGNVISFLVFLRDKLKTSTTFLFQALSVIDTLMLITVFPMYFMPNLVGYTGWYSEYQTSGYQVVLVHLFPFIFIVQTSTIWVTVLVGINRYIAVCMPYQAVRLCTVAQAKRQLATVLILAIVYNAPKFAEGRLKPFPGVDRPPLVCAVHTTLMDNYYYRVIYGNILYCVFMLVVPLVTLTVLNVRLMAALKDVNQRRREMQSARQQQDNNVTLVLIVVVIVFSVCQFPALVTQLSWNFLPDEARLCGGFQFYFSRISNALVVTNSAVNFLIYFRFNKRFRTILGQLVGGRPSVSGHTVSSVGGGRGATSSRRHPLMSATSMAARGSMTACQAAQVGLGRRLKTSADGLLSLGSVEDRVQAATTDGRTPPPTSKETLEPNLSPGGDINDENEGPVNKTMTCTSLRSS